MYTNIPISGEEFFPAYEVLFNYSIFEYFLKLQLYFERISPRQDGKFIRLIMQ